MHFSNKDIIIIPAEKIEETETAVIITNQGKRTIINNSAILPSSANSGYIAFAKILNTRIGVLVEPIYSDEIQNFTIAETTSDNADTVQMFTIEEFVDIYLDSLEIRTAISDGKYTFYHNNLIPTTWTMLSDDGLNTALKKSKKRRFCLKRE